MAFVANPFSILSRRDWAIGAAGAMAIGAAVLGNLVSASRLPLTTARSIQLFVYAGYAAINTAWALAMLLLPRRYVAESWAWRFLLASGAASAFASVTLFFAPLAGDGVSLPPGFFLFRLAWASLLTLNTGLPLQHYIPLYLLLILPVHLALDFASGLHATAAAPGVLTCSSVMRAAPAYWLLRAPLLALAWTAVLVAISIIAEDGRGTAGGADDSAKADALYPWFAGGRPMGRLVAWILSGRRTLRHVALNASAARLVLLIWWPASLILIAIQGIRMSHGQALSPFEFALGYVLGMGVGTLEGKDAAKVWSSQLDAMTELAHDLVPSHVARLLLQHNHVQRAASSSFSTADKAAATPVTPSLRVSEAGYAGLPHHRLCPSGLSRLAMGSRQDSLDELSAAGGAAAAGGLCTPPSAGLMSGPDWGLARGSQEGDSASPAEPLASQRSAPLPVPTLPWSFTSPDRRASVSSVRSSCATEPRGGGGGGGGGAWVPYALPPQGLAPAPSPPLPPRTAPPLAHAPSPSHGPSSAASTPARRTFNGAETETGFGAEQGSSPSALWSGMFGQPAPSPAPAAPSVAFAHECVTILFADIVGFTDLSNKVDPHQMFVFLNELYARYDAVVDRFGVYKVETIGDCYMCATGLVQEDPDHARHMVEFAEEMQRQAGAIELPGGGGGPVRTRIGIHSGPVLSGVIGRIRRRYCVVGSTVNVASRMESTGEAGRVHVSAVTRDLVEGGEGGGSGCWEWRCRGEVEVKGIGPMVTYFLHQPGAAAPGEQPGPLPLLAEVPEEGSGSWVGGFDE